MQTNSTQTYMIALCGFAASMSVVPVNCPPIMWSSFASFSPTSSSTSSAISCSRLLGALTSSSESAPATRPRN